MSAPDGDPFCIAGREALDEAVAWIGESITGLDAAALNRAPAGADSNSIAVLATHALHSTRSWLSVALGAPLPARDRGAEFIARATSADELRAAVDAVADDCRALLAGARDVDWSARRRTHPRPRPDASDEVTAAWAFVHAFEHLKEHAGQLALTRQVLAAGTRGG